MCRHQHQHRQQNISLSILRRYIYIFSRSARGKKLICILEMNKNRQQKKKWAHTHTRVSQIGIHYHLNRFLCMWESILMTLCAHFSPNNSNNNKPRGKYLQYATVWLCGTHNTRKKWKQNSGIEEKKGVRYRVKRT